MDAVLYEPYKRAWQERVGAIPANLGPELRRLIGIYLSSHKESLEGDARGSTSIRAALMLMKAEAERMHEQARDLNIALYNRNFGSYAHLRFRPGLLESALSRAIEALAEDS